MNINAKVTRVDDSIGITLSEAKATFENGNVKKIKIDVSQEWMHMVICTKVAEKKIMTQRKSFKEYKSINSILNDYAYITSSCVKSFNIN